MNSVLKMFIDIFSVAETAGMFYTNDTKVLIDIIVRQLTDLCAGNPVSSVIYILFKLILQFLLHNLSSEENALKIIVVIEIFTFRTVTNCAISTR